MDFHPANWGSFKIDLDIDIDNIHSVWAGILSSRICLSIVHVPPQFHPSQLSTTHDKPSFNDSDLTSPGASCSTVTGATGTTAVATSSTAWEWEINTISLKIAIAVEVKTEWLPILPILLKNMFHT